MEKQNTRNKPETLKLEDFDIVDDFTMMDLVKMAMEDDSWEPDPAKRQKYVQGIFMANASIL